MKFTEMLLALRNGYELTQKAFATSVGVSPQYQHDLEHGRRLPSVAYVDAVCAAFGRGPKGTKEWHAAAAREHGWRI